ncbi:MAG TPA: phosphotransferase [Streptosporangiaceae bacterium]|nr:phosphotransferase [Streptosporangiaceae bacterium]
MQPLQHSYTNRTLGDGASVVKCYQGRDALARLENEQAVLNALRGRGLPVPQVLGSEGGRLTMTFMNGVHGQELLEAGGADRVLRACGATLRRIHRLDTARIAAAVGHPAAAGHVLIHGDYGPQNVLLDPAAMEISAILDWEWAHTGDRVEDLAWCEWIIRMHHPSEVGSLGTFFDAYGGTIPSWPDRHAFMLDRCRSLLDFCHGQAPGGAAEAQWRHRAAVTGAWPE